MFTNTKCSIYAGQDKVYTESVCLSTDVKPTTGIANGSVCLEMNTGKKYMFNEDGGEWVEVPSSGGGGGGDSDFSTAQVTVVSTQEHVDDWLVVLINDGAMGVFNSVDTGTNIMPLYKGHLDTVFFGDISHVSVSGDASIDHEYSLITITGDCTITVTA